MRRTINNFISVLFTAMKFCVMKLFHWKGFSFSMVERFSPNVVTEFNKSSRVKLGKSVRVHSGTKIKVRNNAFLSIGDGVKINYNCIIVARESIEIGAGTEFGPGIMIYDHDHDYKTGLKQGGFLSTPVKIGKNCWIGANSVILRGTEIGDNCVIGAGCIIKDKLPENSIFVQKRVSEIRSY